MPEQQDLPATHRALVQHIYAQPLVVDDVSTPQPAPGSAIIRVDAAGVISYQRDVYNGKRLYQYPTPIVPGASAIGRVVAVGPDATALRPGQLVMFDPFIHGRDDPMVAMLSGLTDAGNPGARTLMAGEWRDSTFAQFVKAPLENCLRLDETRLCGSPADGGLSYTSEQLLWIVAAIVPYGGLRSIGLQAGETIIVAPATGGFGSAAALVATAMGARVIAMGRNVDALRRLDALSDRIRTVPISGDHEVELRELTRFGRVDAFLDISPRVAVGSTHLKSAIMSLRKGGRVSLMGGLPDDVPFPHGFIMRQDITLKGKWMYDATDARDFIKLVEAGVLSLSHVKVAGKFSLEQWEQAFEVAAGQRIDEVTVLSGWSLRADQDLGIAVALCKDIFEGVPEGKTKKTALSWMIIQPLLGALEPVKLFYAQEYKLPNEWILQEDIGMQIRARLDYGMSDQLKQKYRLKEGQYLPTFEGGGEYYQVILIVLMMVVGAKLKDHDRQHLRDLAPQINCNEGTPMPFASDGGFRGPGNRRDFVVSNCHACGKTAADTGHSLEKCGGCQNDYAAAYFCDKDCQKSNWKVHKQNNICALRGVGTAILKAYSEKGTYLSTFDAANV